MYICEMVLNVLTDQNNLEISCTAVFLFNTLPVSVLGLLRFDYCLFCCYVVSSISSPFRRLFQADHMADEKTRPQHHTLFD